MMTDEEIKSLSQEQKDAIYEAMFAEQEKWDHEAEVRGCERWLQTLGIELWADWLITSTDSRRKAAEWFVAQKEAFEAFSDKFLNSAEGDEFMDEMAYSFITEVLAGAAGTTDA